MNKNKSQRFVYANNVTRYNQEEKKQLPLTYVLSGIADQEIRKLDEEIDGMVMPPLSRRHKIRMNRLFRERVRDSFLPFPEEDNIFERIRSKLIIKLKINEFLDYFRKKRLHKREIS